MVSVASLLVLAALAADPAPVPPPTAVAPEPAPGTPAPPAWTGSAGLGFISTTGNSRSLTLNLTGIAERKSEWWIFGTRAFATYGEARLAGQTATQTTALAAGLQLRVDRRITPALSAYALAAADTDHVKSLEARFGGELGVAYQWYDWKGDNDQTFTIRNDLGVRLARELRFQYYPVPLDVPDVTLVAPRLGLSAKYALNKQVSLQEDAEVLPDVNNTPRVLVNSITRVVAKLTTALQFGVGFTINHDSRPAPGKVDTDTTLGITLEYIL